MKSKIRQIAFYGKGGIGKSTIAGRRRVTPVISFGEII